MANIFKDILNSMKLTDDYDDDDIYDDDYEEELKKDTRKTRRELTAASNESKSSNLSSPDSNVIKKERVSRVERTSTNKVVPMRTVAKGLEVCIMKPTSFEESQEICDMLLTGRATVINLEGFDDKLAQRTMDFVSGCVYAINGKLHRISSCIFIISPDNVDISGDYLDLIQQNGFEPPKFENQF